MTTPACIISVARSEHMFGTRPGKGAQQSFVCLPDWKEQLDAHCCKGPSLQSWLLCLVPSAAVHTVQQKQKQCLLTIKMSRTESFRPLQSVPLWSAHKCEYCQLTCLREKQTESRLSFLVPAMNPRFSCQLRVYCTHVINS